MRSAFCSVCNRQVNLADGDPLSCPVCSSPLIETAEVPDHPPSAHQLLVVRPEVYLG